MVADSAFAVESCKFGVQGKVHSAAFSWQGKLLALISSLKEYRSAQLTVWDAHDGRMLSTLWPVEWHSSTWGTPLWWNGGQYLVAPVLGYVTLNKVGVWDVSTGRLTGTLGGCGGMGVLIEGNEVFQHCPDRRILQWSIDALQAQIPK
jgi:WD40 repeat protein